MNIRAAAAFVALSATLACPQGHAQSRFPDRPIRIVLPTTPGGPLDVMTRILGVGFEAKWGQTAIPDPHPGAAQNIAADLVYRSAPDGYTLMLAAPTPYAVNQYLFSKLTYDPTGFVPISVLMSAPNFLLVRAGLPAKSVADVIALAKAKNGALTYGSTGIGSTLHLTGEAFKMRAGVNIVHVPYKGSADMMTDMLGGRIDMAFVNIVDAWPRLQAGSLRALAIGSSKRSPDFPDLPALSEFWPGFQSEVWFALAAPPKTPAAIIDKLNEGVRAAFATEQAKKFVAAGHATLVLDSPSEAAAYIHADSERWRDVIVANHIRIDQ
jgi:tripartite-type tricarboxylate transporter receptor subunit TctC